MRALKRLVVSLLSSSFLILICNQATGKIIDIGFTSELTMVDPELAPYFSSGDQMDYFISLDDSISLQNVEGDWIYPFRTGWMAFKGEKYGVSISEFSLGYFLYDNVDGQDSLILRAWGPRDFPGDGWTGQEQSMEIVLKATHGNAFQSEILDVDILRNAMFDVGSVNTYFVNYGTGTSARISADITAITELPTPAALALFISGFAVVFGSKLKGLISKMRT